MENYWIVTNEETNECVAAGLSCFRAHVLAEELTEETGVYHESHEIRINEE